MNRRFYCIACGILAAALLFIAASFMSVSKAELMNMEERFETISTGEKLSKAAIKGDYAVDRAHSYLGFRVTHMGLAEVPGSFKDFKGTVSYDAKNVKNSTVEFTAMMKSVDTRVNGRDNHLRSKDFFEVEKYPEMTFKSTRVKKKGKNKVRVYGNLTMKGVTKEVMIPVKLYGPIKDQRGNMKMGVRGKTAINRRDFGVNYGRNLPNGTQMISDLVTIDIQLETVMRAKKADGK